MIPPATTNKNYFSSATTRWQLTPATEFARRLDGIERDLQKLFAEALEHHIDLSAYVHVWGPYRARLDAIFAARRAAKPPSAQAAVTLPHRLANRSID